jgi:formylglycine-generating enzyme required for sulfatase activity
MIIGGEKERALKRCFRNGITALVNGTRNISKEEQNLVNDIFTNFFLENDVAEELFCLLEGKSPNRESLFALFEMAGYEPSQLPGIDFEDAIDLFEEAFIETAIEEESLHEIIKINELRKQSHIQERILIIVRDLLISFKESSLARIVDQYFQKNHYEAIERENLHSQIASYLKWMRDRYGKIELRGIKRRGQQVIQLGLGDIYVPLEAIAYRKFDYDEIQIDDLEGGSSYDIKLDKVLELGKRIVITGGPGCGKTTVLLYIAWSLSTALATGDQYFAKEKLGLKKDLPLPLFVPLSLFAIYRRNNAQSKDPRKRTLAAFISDFLIEKQSSFDLPNSFFEKLLQNGQQVILLLDGLDEVPNEEDRILVRQSIEELVTGRDDLRTIVTCRSAAYRDQTALGKGFQEVRVKALNKQQYTALIHQAYQHLYRHDPTEYRRKIEEILGSIDKFEEERRQRLGSDVEPLVTSPLIVRLLLVVHFNSRRLPEQRAELYMKATDALLLPDYAPDDSVALEIGRLIGKSKEQHRELVQHLAYAMHTKGAEVGREITEQELRSILMSNPSFSSEIDEFIGLTRLRGTLLEERLGFYRFIHLSFQEFLTARYMAEVKRGEEGVNGIVSFLERGVLIDTWWREPILLTAGYLSITSPHSAKLFIKRLAGIDKEAIKRKRILEADYQIASAELSAAGFLEWQPDDNLLRQELVDRIIELFTNSSIMKTAKAVLRVSVGDSLAKLGDRRVEITSIDEIQFCYVPSGPFWMGCSDEDTWGDANEKPFHLVENLNDNYWISRYPITIAQFRIFIEDSGHELHYPESVEGLFNHPVSHITWYDAIEFCSWLTERWHSKKLLPKSLKVDLPSEAQWEKAARGGEEVPDQPVLCSINTIKKIEEVRMKKNPIVNRRYPWGNEASPEFANFKDNNFRSTSALGCFSNGSSPYGCEDMSGNVWEWTKSPFENYPRQKEAGEELAKIQSKLRLVVRGGSFVNSKFLVRCTTRSFGIPFRTNFDYGFRIVLNSN